MREEREGSRGPLLIINSDPHKGNPVSCAIASAVLDVIEKEKLIQHAQYIGQLLVEGAKKLALKYQVKIFVDC